MADTELQALLDAQWDALAARSKHIRVIRRSLIECLTNLAELRRKDAQESFNEAEELKGLRRQFDDWQSRYEEISSRLNDIRTGDISQMLSSTRRELAEVENRRIKLAEKERELSSVLASRCAPLEEVEHQLYSNKPCAPVDFEERLSLLESARAAAEKEAAAAIDGSTLWQTVCCELSDLDESIKTIALDQVPFIITQKISVLTDLCNQASASKWHVLVVAIGHELVILNQAAEAIREKQRHDI